MNCDLDLYSSDMVLASDTLSCHDDHLQSIFKSHDAGQSYKSDMILEHTNENMYTNTHTETGKTIMPFLHFMAEA